MSCRGPCYFPPLLSEHDLASHLRQGRSYREIAEAVGCTKRTIQGRVAHLRGVLAARMGNEAFLTVANPVELGRAWFGEELDNPALAPTRALVPQPHTKG